VEYWIGSPRTARAVVLDALVRAYYAHLRRGRGPALRFAQTVRLARQVDAAHRHRAIGRRFPDSARPDRLETCDVDAEGASLIGTSR